jgi:HD-GYP domain-containing protein (c-di-GMP phosphodiesterase class II)
MDLTLWLAVLLGLALIGVGGAAVWCWLTLGRERRERREAEESLTRRAQEMAGRADRLTDLLETLPGEIAALHAATDRADIGNALARALGNLLTGYQFLVLSQETPNRLQGLAGHGVGARLVRSVHEEPPGPLAALLQRGEAVSLSDDEWRAIGRLDIMVHLRGRVTAVPLLADGRAVGLLLLGNGRPDPLPLTHLPIIRALADTAAHMLGQRQDTDTAATPALLPEAPVAPTISSEATEAIAGLTRELKGAFDNVTALLGADQAIDWVAVAVERTAAAKHEEAEMLQIAAEALQRGLLADACVIHTWEKQRLILQSHLGLDVPQLTALVHDLSPAIRRAAEQRTVVPAGTLAATNHRAHLALPINRGQTLLGVATAMWKVPHPVTGQDVALGTIFAGLASLALDNARLYEEMVRIVGRATNVVNDREIILGQFLHGIATLVDNRQVATANHSRRVADHASAIAKRLGFSAPQEAAIRAAALVHDVGYLGVQATRGTPTAAAHPLLGSNFLAGLPFLNGLQPLVLHHLENFDGTGFPHGLRGEAIPMGARILAVAHTFDLLTSPAATGIIAPLPLPDRLPCSAARALAIIQAAAGRQFDPRVVAALAVELTEPTSPRRIA